MGGNATSAGDAPVNDLSPVFGCLATTEVTALQNISDSLAESWAKRQVFRTETEARFSVLNDASFPTQASKYWQVIREQTVMLDNLTIMSFDMRRNQTALRRAQAKLAEATDALDREDAQIEVDELLWKIASAEQVAKDRVREITMWEGFKRELDDGSFDSKQVDTHQKDSMFKQLTNRAQCLTEQTPSGELMNIYGPLETLKKSAEVERLSMNEVVA
jgi:hypothetical protein